MKIVRLIFLSLLSVSAAESAIVVTGNPRTGSPLASVQITAPIVLTSTSATGIIAIAMDEWVASDSTGTSIPFAAGSLLSYQINGGPTQTVPLLNFRDNIASNTGAVTVNDGAIVWGAANPIVVPVGQTFTILPGTFALSGSDLNFNPAVPTNYQGAVFSYGAGGIRTSNNTTIPEPATTMVVTLGSLVLLRRRR